MTVKPDRDSKDRITKERAKWGVQVKKKARAGGKTEKKGVNEAVTILPNKKGGKHRKQRWPRTKEGKKE